MVLDFAKECIDNQINFENIHYIKCVNSCLHPENWTREMQDAFILGHKLGVKQ